MGYPAGLVMGLVEGHLDPINVTASWGSDPDNIRFVNTAFSFYYQCRKNIDRYNGTIRGGMLEELTKLLNHGWYGHVANLAEAFQHMVDTGANTTQASGYSFGWTDDGTTDYKGGPGKAFGTKVDKAPRSIVHFMEGVDEMIKECNKYMIDFGNDASALGPLSASDQEFRRNWRETHEKLEKITKGTDKAMKFLFVTKQDLEHFASGGGKASGKFMQSLGVLKEAFEPGLKVVDVFLKLDSAVKDYDSYTSNGIPPDFAKSFAAMRVFASFLPVIGGVYEEFFNALPGILKDITDAWAQHRKNMNDAYLGYATPGTGRVLAPGESGN